ncbi:MAG: hypothetical protein IJ728_12315 [Selenomonadaceae bacterium]|nr:hypothetical protein [Selenomonadaceae bacterium]
MNITNGSISQASISGNDVILKIGSGSIRINNAKNKSITIKPSSGKVFSTVVGSGGNEDKLTLTNSDSASVTLNSKVKIADAAKRYKSIRIVGNSLNNSIVGGSKDDTLLGGKGNDTLTGGKGKDVFIYANGEGNDLITDYTPGQDKIKLTSGSITKSSIKGSDVILTIGNGSIITVKNAKGKVITVTDSANKTTSKVYGEDNSTSLTVTNSTKSPLTISSTIKTVDATKRTTTMKITGNALSNTIKGGSGIDTIYGGAGNDSILGNNGNDKLFGDAGDDTLSGGKGNDTLTGGAGNDIFVYSSGDGNDVIADFSAGQDRIYLGTSKVTKTSLSGSDVVLKIGTGSLTIKNGKGKNITTINSGNKTTNYHVTTTRSAAYAEEDELWFAKDDNFASDDVDSLMSESKAVSNNSIVSTTNEFESTFELSQSDQLTTTLNYNKKKSAK